MKSKFLMAMLCQLLIINCALAQLNIPTAVENKFKEMFPKATQVKWDKESKLEYEASFILDGKKASANFLSNGEWKETEVFVDKSSVPKTVLEAVTTKWQTAIIKDVFEIKTNNGKHYFEVEYILKGKKKEAKVSKDGVLM